MENLVDGLMSAHDLESLCTLAVYLLVLGSVALGVGTVWHALRAADAEISDETRSLYDVPAYQRRAPRAPRGPVPQPPREQHLRERIRTARERVSREG